MKSNHLASSVTVVLTFVFLIHFHVFSLTVHEQNALDEFKDLAHSYLYRDFMKNELYLLRWLRAYDFNVYTALHKFLGTLQWRRDNDIDNIIFEDFSMFEESFPYYVAGFDKDGRPIIWIPAGSYDIRKVAIAGKMREFIRYLLSISEMFQFYLDYLPQNETINGGIWITDFTGVSLKRMLCMKCAEIVPETMSVTERHYPEVQYRAILINVPKMFSLFLDLMRNGMSKRTIATMESYGFDKEKWSHALVELIPIDQLPIEYGGTKVSAFKKPHKLRNADFLAIVQKEKEKLRAIAMPMARHTTVEYPNEPWHLQTSDSVAQVGPVVPAGCDHDEADQHQPHHHYGKQFDFELEPDSGGYGCLAKDCNKGSVVGNSKKAGKSGTSGRHSASHDLLLSVVFAFNLLLFDYLIQSTIIAVVL